MNDIGHAAVNEEIGVDRGELTAFVETMFRYADQGTWISLRAFHDDRDGTWRPQRWPAIAVNGSLKAIIDAAVNFAQECAAAHEPVVFAPPVWPCRNLRAKSADLKNTINQSVA
jgi:hypothetical protein